jgi:hypothetical protein
MAHLLMLRECQTFIEVPNAIYGTDEQIERAIEKRKYPFNGGRNGYNTPQSTEIKLKCYRLKKEIIPDFLTDIGGIILNPKTLPKGIYWCILPTFLRRIFISDKKFYAVVANNHYATLGVTIQLIQIFMHFLCKLPLIPLKSVDPSPQGVKQPKLFATEWNYNYIIGYFDDIDRGFGEEL